MINKPISFYMEQRIFLNPLMWYVPFISFIWRGMKIFLSGDNLSTKEKKKQL